MRASINVKTPSRRNERSGRQLHRRRAGAAQNTYVDRCSSVYRLGNRPEIQSPSIYTRAPMKKSIESPREPLEADERPLMPSTDKESATGQRSHCNPAIQERQRGAKSSRCDVRQTCRSFDHSGEVPGGRERIHVSPTPAEPAIKAVSKGRRVGNGNVQTADLRAK